MSVSPVRNDHGVLTTLIVPLDGSPLAETALSPARALADKAGAQLRIVRAAWDDEEEARDYLSRVAADLGLDLEESARVVRAGVVADSIVREAAASGSIICMTTHGRSGLGHAVLGSTAEAVLLASEHPIFLVGPGLEPGAWESEYWFLDGKALVTIDGSTVSEAVLPAAAQWSRMLELEPWIVEVIPADPGLEASATGDIVETASVRRAARALQDLGAVPQWDVLRDDNAARALLDYARHLPAALVAMATHGRSGVARTAMGSITMRVVRDSACPVLVVPASPRH